MSRLLEAERRSDEAGGQFAVARQRALERGNLDAQRPHALVQVLGSLLHHVERVHALGEVAQRLLRKRPGEAQLEHGRVGQRFHDVLVDGAGAHHAHGAPLAHDLVVGALLGPGAQRVDARQLHLAAGLGERGHHDPLCRVALVGSGLDLFSGPDLDRRLRMRDAHRRADEEGHIESFGKLERVARESERLGGISGVEHGNMRRAGVVVRILLVL